MADLVAADVEIPDGFGNAFEVGCFVDENFAVFVFRESGGDFVVLEKCRAVGLQIPRGRSVNGFEQM